VCSQKNGAVSNVNKKFISHLTRAQRTLSAAATVQVSYALPAVRFSCLLRGRGASFKDGVAAGKDFLCSSYWGVQVCDYSAAVQLQCSGLEKTHHAWCRSSKRLSVCSVLRCPDLWLQCSVSFMHGLEKTHAWETWTVAAADSVPCARVRWEINFLLTFEPAPFFCEHTVYPLSLYTNNENRTVILRLKVTSRKSGLWSAERNSEDTSFASSVKETTKFPYISVRQDLPITHLVYYMNANDKL
jgi:hypothetical protein